MFVYILDHFKSDLQTAQVTHAVVSVAAEFRLVKGLEQVKQTRSHWHWRRTGLSGTLEVTWDYAIQQVFVTVHRKRIGTDGWAKRDAPKFARALASTLNAQVKTSHATHRD